MSVFHNSPISDIDKHKILQSRYLINSLYLCSICNYNRNINHCIEDFLEQQTNFKCCNQHFETSLLSPRYDPLTRNLIQSYMMERPINSFYSTPALKNQGLIECYVLKTKEGYDMYLSIKKNNTMLLMKDLLLNNETINFENEFPLPNINKSIIKRCHDFGDEIIKNGNDIFLMSSRKVMKLFGECYHIFSDKDCTKSLGYLRSNFKGRLFHLYNDVKPVNFKHLLTISYRNLYPFNGSPVHLEVIYPNCRYDIKTDIENKGDLDIQFEKEFPSKIVNQEVQPLIGNTLNILSNVNPVWNDGIHGYVINFDNYRVKERSVKNFKIHRKYTENGDDKICTSLQFGRTYDKNIFILDYSYPFSPLTAFGVCLSSICRKSL